MNLDMLGIQLLQVTLLIVSVGIAHRFFARRHPFLLYALWAVVLVKCVTPPVIASPSGLFCWVLPATTKAQTLEPIESRDADQTRLDNGEREAASELTVEITTDVATQPPVQMNTSPAVRSDASKAFSVGEAPVNIPGSKREVFAQYAATVLLSAVWFAGFLFRLTRQTRLLRALKRKIDQAATDEAAHWMDDFQMVGERLKLRRLPELRVTTESIGPLVLGSWRPVVVVPLYLLENNSRSFRLAIFTHELLHIRRGDVWVSRLQFIVSALWWFHPLVHWAIRKMNQVTETCCDENAVAELDMPATQYARHLLSVLENKSRLHSLSFVPGVRTGEITSKRLERVMRLRQGCHKRTPWWAWTVLAITAMVALPGGAFLVGQEPTKQVQEASRADKTADKAKEESVGEAAEEPVTLPPRFYLKDDVQLLPSHELKIQEPMSAERLEELLSSKVMVLPSAKRTYDLKGAVQRIVEEGTSADEDSALELLTQMLVGRLDSNVYVRKGYELSVVAMDHARIQREIEATQKFGLRSIRLEIKYLIADRADMEELTKGWPLLSTGTDKESVLVKQEQALSKSERSVEARQPSTSVRRFVEESEVLHTKVFDAEGVQPLLSLFKEGSKWDMISAPKVLVHNGRTATVGDTTQRVFVTGSEAIFDPKDRSRVLKRLPVVSIVECGKATSVRSEWIDENQIWLDTTVTVSELLGVEEKKAESLNSLDDETWEYSHIKVQVPRVAKTVIEASRAVPVGGGLAIAGIRNNDDDREMLILIRCLENKAEDKTAEAPAQNKVTR